MCNITCIGTNRCFDSADLTQYVRNWEETPLAVKHYLLLQYIQTRAQEFHLQCLRAPVHPRPPIMSVHVLESINSTARGALTHRKFPWICYMWAERKLFFLCSIKIFPRFFYPKSGNTHNRISLRVRLIGIGENLVTLHNNKKSSPFIRNHHVGTV